LCTIKLEQTYSSIPQKETDKKIKFPTLNYFKMLAFVDAVENKSSLYTKTCTLEIHQA
jgi:hypothetical protein